MAVQVISGFTNIKDAVKGKFPFVETILSALPVCDEFVVSDGYSTDGTWEILKKLANKHSKIKLVRIEWKPKANKKGKIFAQTANETREYCKGDYLFYLQAGEIIHEDSVNRLRSLPEEHPKITLFHIPYYLIFGTNIIGLEDFRIRFVKNIKNIRVSGDGNHMCYGRMDILKGVMSSFKNPFTFELNLKKVMTPYGFGNEPFSHVILPMPIFRYGTMFKKSYLAKLEAHAKLNSYKNSLSNRDKMAKYVIENTNNSNFGQKMYEYSRQDPPPYSSAFLFKPIKLDIKQHPKIMQGLLAKNNDDYYIRKELLK